MEPRFVEKPAFTIAGLRYRGRDQNEEIRHMWEGLIPRAGEIPHIAGPAYGYSAMLEGAAEGEFEYIAGFEVGRVDDNLPAGMVSLSLPAHRYAVFSTTLATMMADMHRIYEEWLPAAGYTPAENWMFEYYPADFAGPESPFDVYVPVG
jgi:AraC family transcriptional regulator